jgi:beta-phosphoglucomutase
MMKNPEAFLFDLNGTMIDDMKYHLEVWFEMITKNLGANLTREEVRYRS